MTIEREAFYITARIDSIRRAADSAQAAYGPNQLGMTDHLPPLEGDHAHRV